MGESWSMTLGDLAGAVGGRPITGAGGTRATGVSIDSRSLCRGDLFIAIRGARFDGHRFVADALERGAAGALVSDAAALGTPPSPGIVVDDTLHALQTLARHVRRGSGARVVAVTGSVGKTTTKELAAALLSTRYRVFRNRGNLNNHIGLPLSLLELRARPEMAVVELGMSGPGEIRRLVDIAEPDVRVWTNVAEAHAAFFPSIEAIADAKAEILTGAGRDAVAVANAADQRVMRRVSGFPGRVVTFGTDVEADVTASGVEDLGLDGMRARLRSPAGSAALRTRLLGRGNLANVLAAIAVATTLEVPLAAAVERAATVEAPPHRGRIHRLAGGVVVIDDSYNSSPLAVETALAALPRGPRAGRRVAVLGEMLELGARSVDLHRAAGRAAAGLGLLLTVGGDPARALGRAAVDAGAAAANVLHCDSSEEAAARAAALIRDDDVVLVKGSRGVRTDLIVTRLCAERAAGTEGT
jgi:UDP-N-acetylmuramoyl-tripeptide--D-alanyl-D-alanine ligase